MLDWKEHSLRLTEVFRAGLEYYTFRNAWREREKDLPRGDGHPVLVLPGFSHNDLVTQSLRTAIAEKGYAVYGWDQGLNLGIREETARQLVQQLKRAYKENGNQPVSLVGHSLGGIYARELAKEFPRLVRNVITLTSPFGLGVYSGETPHMLMAAVDFLSDKKYSIKAQGMSERFLAPPRGVPTTSIFSREDGIVPWRACLNPETPLSENIEVTGSHTGAVWNVDTLALVLERLAQKKEGWQPHGNPSPERAKYEKLWNPPKNKDWKLFPDS